MYTCLVGGPGVGKGQAIIPSVAVIDKSGTANILPDRLTMPFILEKLSKGFPSQVVVSKGAISLGLDHCGIVIADELRVFVDTGGDVLTNMTALWDSREHPYGYGTRGRGEANIDKPGISFLSATTPRWLATAIPITAVGGGFTRRVNFVYEKPHPKTKPFPSPNHSDLRDNLVNDLRHIASNIVGEYKFSPEVRPLFETYYKGCVVGELEDEATATYKDSAWVHCLKLSMAIQAAMNDDDHISLQAWNMATSQIASVIKDIELVFRGVGMGDMTMAADRVIAFLETTGYATRQQIQRMMWQYAMSPDLDIILTTLEGAGMIISFTQGKTLVYQAVKGAKKP